MGIGVVGVGEFLFWRGVWSGGDGGHGHFCFFFGLEIDLRAVWGPCVGLDAAIEIFSAIDGFGGLAIVEHEAPAIGFVAALQLGAIGDPFSVGGIGGAPIFAGIGGGALRFGRAGCRNGEEIAVGA